MNNTEIVKLTGTALGNEVATVTVAAADYEPNGANLMVSVKVIEFEFLVKTFFFGFNLSSFLEAAEQPNAAGEGFEAVTLYNYNESLECEFLIQQDKKTCFLSIAYGSPLPDAPDQALDRKLQKISKVSKPSLPASFFSISLLPIHNGWPEITQAVAKFLAASKISTRNPYGFTPTAPPAPHLPGAK